MGSEVIRVCVTDGDDSRDSDLGSSFSSPKLDRDVSLGMDHGIASSSMASMSVSDVRQMQRKVGKVPRNGSVSFKKLQMLQTEISSPRFEANDSKVERDKLGMPLLKCSNTDKSATVKQKSNINGRRGDRRNYKVQMKGRFDPFSLKAGLPNCSPSSGGSNTFGMYGLKPDIHDVTKLIEDISLKELLDGSYKHSTTLEKDKGKKASHVNDNDNILDSVRKACSVLRFSGLQQGKQSEEADVNAKHKTSSLSSPCSIGALDSSDGDDGTLAVCLSKCSEDQESFIKADVPSDTNHTSLFDPKHFMERLSLPQPKDLDSLLQDASKLTASVKLTESRSLKQLSHCFTLPPFSWSGNFNGHYKSNNDATRNTSKSTCQGRWVRISNSAVFIGSGSDEGYLDFDSLTYDDSLVPVGQGKYRLPEVEKTVSTSVSHDCSRHDPSSVACSTYTLPSHASHSPTILTAAQTLCDIATHWTENNEIMTCPKQPLQKSTKSRKSRPGEKTDGGFIIAPTSETVHDNLARSVHYGSFKKPKMEVVSYPQTVVGLSSVSAPRSSRCSPIKLTKDSVAEVRSCNRTFTKPPFVLPPPRRVVDRSSNNHPQKLRKVGPGDWNKTRS